MVGLLPNIPFYCIHLESEESRMELINTLEERLGRPLVMWPASVGSEVAKLGWPRRHPHQGQTKDGELGCLSSHLHILTFMRGDVIGIFEDDAEVICEKETLEAFVGTVEEIDPDWDILFLGANEWVESLPFAKNRAKPQFELVRRIQRFWGTHAFLIRRRAANLVIATHEKALKEGFAYPADWLYAKTIKEYSLKVYGPADPKSMIRQKPGLVSSITGNIRGL
jgi:GR25 family glycosyltransferase involved in LPS biosynthesis